MKQYFKQCMTKIKPQYVLYTSIEAIFTLCGIRKQEHLNIRLK